MTHRALAFVTALLLTACATQPKEVPVVYDPNAEPLIRRDIENFETCFLEVDSDVVQALVEVELETTRDGFVENARISRSTDPCLDEPALDAVRQWRYPPKMVEGELARRRGVKVLFAFNFEKEREE